MNLSLLALNSLQSYKKSVVFANICPKFLYRCKLNLLNFMLITQINGA